MNLFIQFDTEIMKTILSLLAVFITLFHSNSSFAQVEYLGGDSCETAVPITPGSFITPADGIGDDHWYSFVAPCSGLLSLSNGDSECEKRIYTGGCGSLILLAEGLGPDSTISYTLTAGDSAYIKISDSWVMSGAFIIEFDDCDEIDSSLLDISGKVYYDLNNNGIKDLDEVGRPLNFIITDPVGLICVSGADGFYYSSVAGLDDGLYEISPVLPEYWEISTDSLTYTIAIDVDFEQRDSLDFGIYPDSLFHQVNLSLEGGYPRCNDTIYYWLDIQNTGTTIASGLVHLQIDDSLYYVTADIVPDSIVGQHLYWHYDALFFGENNMITVQLGTPDGIDDLVSSTLEVTIDSAGVDVFFDSVDREQLITCAYDPNDKTPNPLGEGDLGYISPETEYIEYVIRFQNTGTDTAQNVIIKDQLDEHLQWLSLTVLSYSHEMRMEMNIDGEVQFIFEDIMLPDSNVNMMASQGYVKYRIDLFPDLPLETSIFNTAEIYFDLNPAVITNTTINTLFLDGSTIEEYTKNINLLVYPNPFSDSFKLYFGDHVENFSLKIIDLMGNQVYANDNINGAHVEVYPGRLAQGMYLLILTDNTTNQIYSTSKIIVK